MKKVLRKIRYYIIDAYESLFGLRDTLTPPRSLIFVGDGDFKKVGEEFLLHFTRVGGLKPSDRVLDVGCGIGRMAVPLTNYLSKEGSYEGIDIVAAGIQWCTKNITPRYPNFRFQLADVFNKLYNPNGTYQPAAYKFPFESNSFDFVFLTSVFTHMLPAGLENYLSEIARVLKPGATCFITFFLLNNESLAHIDKKQSRFDFKYPHGEYRVVSNEVPENAIAYNEDFVRNLYRKYGLEIVAPIQYGSWCGRTAFLSFQDIVVATKS